MNLQQIAQQILPLYSYDTTQPPMILREGIDNDLYVFTRENGNKAVLRISKRDVTETIDFEAKLIQYLSEHQAPVANIVPTSKGELWRVATGITVMAFNFVSGTAFSVEPACKPLPQYAYAAGEALGAVHQAGRSFPYENPKRRTIFTELERALANSHKIDQLTGGSKFIATVKSYHKWARENQEGLGILHNDYIPNNILFEGMAISAVIDFDWACRGPLIKDLGIALATWSLPDGLDQHWQDVFVFFVEGYNQSAPQTLTINEDLYRWICFSCLSDACTFFADLPQKAIEITDVLQCRRYKKFIYFEQFL